MHTLFAFHGIGHSSSLESAVQRWLTRLESVQSLESCAISVRVRWSPLGLGKRASVELAVSDEAGEIGVCRAARFRQDDDLYPLISEAFREMRRRLAERQLAASTAGG